MDRAERESFPLQGAWRLAELAAAAEPIAIDGDPRVVVTSLATDSRRVAEGALFFAVPGARQDGLAFVAEAVARGAAAIVAEGGAALPGPAGGSGRPVVVRVQDCRLAKSRIAARFFAEPSRRLPVVGVTGTNGKTTTAWLIRAVAEYERGPTVLLGTVGHDVCGELRPAATTTPDAIEVHEALARGTDLGARLAVLEASSHALHQHRVADVRFRAAVFTNLTAEHLDYHGTLEDYLEAKARLFTGLAPNALAVLNADDPASDVLAARTKARVLRYGLARGSFVSATVRRVDVDGVSFLLHTPQGDVDVNLGLLGRYNVHNAMAAAAACLGLGYSLDAIRGGFALLPAVPGRMQAVDCGQDFRVLVDYAHTDDALRNVLENLRPLTRGRLITVFGCGGDRDRAKRPRMGHVAADSSDVVFVTSDNPRGEAPEAIIAEVVAGVPAAARARVRVEPDRRAAIVAALAEARGGDIVVIAGKGHETCQLVGDLRLPFDDVAVTREVLWSR